MPPSSTDSLHQGAARQRLDQGPLLVQLDIPSGGAEPYENEVCRFFVVLAASGCLWLASSSHRVLLPTTIKQCDLQSDLSALPRDETDALTKRAFQAAGKDGDLVTLEVLLKAYPFLANARDGDGLPIVHHAAEQGVVAAMALLLRYGADPNSRRLSNGDSLLFMVDLDIADEVLPLIIDAGFDCSARLSEDDPRTPVQYAAQWPEMADIAAAFGKSKIS